MTQMAPPPGYCPWCSTVWSFTYHSLGECPTVKAIEYHPNGLMKRVEFHGGCVSEFPNERLGPDAALGEKPE